MIRPLLIVALSVVFSASANASPFTFDDVVDSHDNLFFTDWGHWYTTDDDAALGAVGSNAARAMQSAGTSFNFSAFDTLKISATGAVQAHGSVETGPDGCHKLDCSLHDGNFRMLPMYGLIGIWSSSATEILPFGDWKDLTSGLGLLYIGNFATLSIPDFPAAYLFLATNDGAFSDNSGEFEVKFVADIPEPGMLALLCAGIIGVAMMRKRLVKQAA